MNWVKKILGLKTEKQCAIHNVSCMYALDDILNEEQIGRAFLYYSKRKEFVYRIMKETDKAYEPSQPEDKNDPSIWKPEYWRWFLAYYS